MADFELQNQGSICLLVPETDEAEAWVDDNIGRDNGYQPWYPSVVIEPRYVGDIVEGLMSDGLTITS